MGWVVLGMLVMSVALVFLTIRTSKRRILHLPSNGQAVAETLLEHGWIDVYFDPRRPGVRVPKQFTHKPRLILKFRRGLLNPDALEIDDKAIEARLTFDGEPFDCKVPFDAVFAIVGEDGRGRVWEESVPPELREEVAAAMPAKNPQA